MQQNWLKLAAEYLTEIKNLENKLIEQIEEENDDLLNPEISAEEIRIILHNEKIRAMIANCKHSLSQLGIRKGLLDSTWLDRLGEKEKLIFRQMYEKNIEIESVSKELGIPKDEVRIYYDKTIKKVLKILSNKNYNS